MKTKGGCVCSREVGAELVRIRGQNLNWANVGAQWNDWKM